MRHVARLRNPILPYAWGSRRAIRALRGLPGEADAPQAEQWYGAHPKAPSEVWTGGTWRLLPDVVAAEPEAVLGAAVAARWHGRMPFLLKVLAAAEPLSIQAHPDRAQARDGFAREEARGVAITAPERSYRDRNDKPELIVALTPFALMRAFRPAAEIERRIAALDLGGRWPESTQLAADGGLRAFLAATLRLPPERAAALVAAAADAAATSADPADVWLCRLAAAYPSDAGALAPLWLEVQTLSPGEAVFTGPGVLHAYLGGTGIELMASSDNVLRGGLTPKHVDVEELLEVLEFGPAGDGRVAVQTAPDLASPSRLERFVTPAEAFALSRLTLAGRCERADRLGIEIVLCTEGHAVLEADRRAELLGQGDAFLVPAAVPSYRLSGSGTFFLAGVP